MNKCVTGKIADNLRNSIIDQIQEFRKSQKKFICEFCKSLDNIQVDPVDPLFSDIKKKNFVSQLQRKYT